MTERSSISKKTRFEVFKRDSFTCAYCGGTPPMFVLEIDHIDPVSKGGGDEIENLITACFDCNRGKGANLLSSVPVSISDNLEMMKEREYQIEQYRKYIKNIQERKNKDIEEVAIVYEDNFPEYQLTSYFKKHSIGRFLEELPLHEVIDAMEKACQRLNDYSDSIKYFCGICWKKIKA